MVKKLIKCEKCGADENYLGSGVCKKCYEAFSESDYMQTFNEVHQNTGAMMRGH